jgi:erythrocyte band 7 integral membrane protein
VISEREAIALEIEEILETVSEKWGVAVESVLIKVNSPLLPFPPRVHVLTGRDTLCQDVIFSTELQQALSSAAQARRVGESKVITAKAEVDAAKLMAEVADILSSPAVRFFFLFHAASWLGVSSPEGCRMLTRAWGT